MTRPAKINLSAWPVIQGTGGMGGISVPPGDLAYEDLTDVDMTGISDGDVPTWDAGSSTWLPGTGGGGGGSLMWFNVMDPAYGAVNDGTTDDTSAINLAIAAWNTAGEGVLYFPAGAGYSVTGALTTITANGLVIGDGMGAYDGSANVSAILFDSQTAVCFTHTGEQLLFRDIGIFNVYSGTPSAGSAIHVNGSFIGQKVDLDSIVVAGFYDNVVRDVGSQWSDRNVWNWGPVRYGESIQNTVNQDAGDWSIDACFYYADTHNGTAAIFQTGAGGGKLVNVKTNGHAGATYTNAIKVAIPNALASTVMEITSSSFENMTGDAILITTTGTGSFGLIAIDGCQFGLYSNNTGRAVKISAATNGTIATNGSIAGVTIDGGTMRTDGTARAAVELVNTDRVTLGTFQLLGFNARYTSSGDTNTTDTTVSVFPSGTSFPGSPATNDMFFRTDRSAIYFYDGTRWLTIHEYTVTVPILDNLMPITATATGALFAPTDLGANGQWITRVLFASFTLATNNGSNFWTLQLVSRTSAGTVHNIGGTANTSADTASTWAKHEIAIGAQVTAGDTHFTVTATKTSSPGNMYLTCEVVYRLIG